jgi:2-iminobutanoate/2-iminopropanoate deaminase
MSAARGLASLALVAVGLAMAACQPQDERATPELRAASEPEPGPRIEVIQPEGMARLPVFSSAIRAGGFIFLSGAIGTVGESLTLIEGGAAAETRQTMENIRAVLDAAGATLDDVVKCTVFLADMADYQAVNEVYAEFFPQRPPARSAVAGSGLALGARVEVECLALAP